MTGTYAAEPLSPTLAPTIDKSGVSGANAGKMAAASVIGQGQGGICVSAGNVERKTPLTCPVNGVHQERAMRLELTTFTLATGERTARSLLCIKVSAPIHRISAGIGAAKYPSDAIPS